MREKKIEARNTAVFYIARDVTRANLPFKVVDSVATQPADFHQNPQRKIHCAWHRRSILSNKITTAGITHSYNFFISLSLP